MNYKYIIAPVPIFLLTTWYFATIAFNDVPFWYKGISDPSYLYLESTLHIARGEFPVHVDNPGASVQYIGAITFRIAHLLSGRGDFTEDVLTRSEYYLSIFRFVLLAIAAISIWLGGFYAFKITQNYIAVLIVQVAPFLTNAILDFCLRFQTICPEILFVPLGIAWLLYLFYLDKQKFILSKQSEIVALALLSALMVATKLTLLPFILFPLLIKAKTHLKLWYIGLFILFFLTFTFLQLFSSEKLFLWIRDLFFASGAYGTGERNIINLQDFINNAISLTQNDLLFTLSLVVNIFLFFYIDKSKPSFRAIRAIGIVQIVYWVMLSKHYIHSYYIYGALFLVAGSFWVIYKGFYETKLQWVTTLSILGILGVVFANHFLIFVKHQQFIQIQKDEIKKVQSFYKKYPNKFCITSYEAIALPCALSYGLLNFTPDLKSSLAGYLKDKYPYTIYKRASNYTLWGENMDIDSLANTQKTILWHVGLYDTEVKRFRHFQLIDSLQTTSGNKLYVFSK